MEPLAYRLQTILMPYLTVLGWQNSATYSSVIVYNIYWIVVGGWFLVQLFLEKKGKYPFMKASSRALQGSGDSLERGTVTGTGDPRPAGGVLSEKELDTGVVVTVS